MKSFFKGIGIGLGIGFLILAIFFSLKESESVWESDS